MVTYPPFDVTISGGRNVAVAVQHGTFEDAFNSASLEDMQAKLPWWNNPDVAMMVAAEAVVRVPELLAEPDMWGPYVPYGFNFGPEVEEADRNSIVQFATSEPAARSWSSPTGSMPMFVQYARANAVSSYTGMVELTESVPWLRPAEVRDISAPGPLPLFGAATAFGLSRQLRRRISMGG